jgi:hypothetical protein
MPNSLDAQLINAIRNRIAAFSTERPIHTVLAVAKEVIAQDETIVRQWTLDKIARLVRREMDKISEPRGGNPYMDYLPGLDLSDPLPLRRGTIRLGDATIRILRESVIAMRALHKERAEQRLATELGRLKRLIIEMSPYARTKPGLTVSAYCELHAAGVEARPAVLTAKG